MCHSLRIYHLEQLKAVGTRDLMENRFDGSLHDGHGSIGKECDLIDSAADRWQIQMEFPAQKSANRVAESILSDGFHRGAISDDETIGWVLELR